MAKKGRFADRGTYKISTAQATNATTIAAVWGNNNFYCTEIYVDAFTTAQTSGTITVALHDASGSLEHTMFKLHVHQHDAASPVSEHQDLRPNFVLPASYSIRVTSPTSEITVECGVMGVTYEV